MGLISRVSSRTYRILSKKKMEETNQLLRIYPSIRPDPETTSSNQPRLKCILTNHQMPKTVKAITEYTNGKKFKRFNKKCAKSSNNKSTFEYEQYLVHLPLTANGNKRICNLTNRIINDNPIDICRHISGVRFFKFLEKWNECQEKGEEYKGPSGRQPKNKNLKARTKLKKKSEGNDDGKEEEGGEDEQDEEQEENEQEENEEENEDDQAMSDVEEEQICQINSEPK